MKKMIPILICGAMVLGSITGCSGNSKEKKTEPAQAAAGQEQAAGKEAAGKEAAGKEAAGQTGGQAAGGNVTWWTWSTEATDAFTKQIDMAKASNPNLKIDLQYTANSSYWTKLPVAISGGTGPDLYQMTRPSFELYAASGQTMDLTEIIKNSPAISEYLDSLSPDLRETYQFDGMQMAIPFSVESTAIAYNKDMLKAAGIEDLKTIEDTWTWDDLREIANKLTVKNNSGETEQYGFYAPPDRIPSWEMIWSHGCEMFNESKDKCIISQEGVSEALRPLIEMYRDDKVSPRIEAAATMSGDDMFISGKIGMIATGIWKMPSFRNITTFEWDVVELPFDVSTGKRVSSSNVLAYVINPKTKNQEATVALLEELVKPEVQKVFADTNTYIPALESVRSSYFEADVPENIIAYQNALSYIHPNTLTQYIPYAQYSQEFSDGLKNALSGKMSLEEALKNAETNINKAMEENKEQFE